MLSLEEKTETLDVPKKRKLKFKNGVVKCPNCGKMMFINMQVCNHCAHPLSADEYRAIRSQLVYGIWGTVLKLGVVISIVLFIVSEFFW